jgi:hypothetical protein
VSWRELSAAGDSLVGMDETTIRQVDRDRSDQVLMIGGITGPCPDCAGERLLVPIGGAGAEFCCTDCDAAVWVFDDVGWAVGDELLERLTG